MVITMTPPSVYAIAVPGGDVLATRYTTIDDSIRNALRMNGLRADQKRVGDSNEWRYLKKRGWRIERLGPARNEDSELEIENVVLKAITELVDKCEAFYSDDLERRLHPYSIKKEKALAIAKKHGYEKRAGKSSKRWCRCQ